MAHHPYQYGVLNGRPVRRDADIWQFDPNGYKNTWFDTNNETMSKLQKAVIEKVNNAGKPVITYTSPYYVPPFYIP